jgi:hypothetical protein
MGIDTDSVFVSIFLSMKKFNVGGGNVEKKCE